MPGFGQKQLHKHHNPLSLFSCSTVTYLFERKHHLAQTVFLYISMMPDQGIYFTVDAVNVCYYNPMFMFFAKNICNLFLLQFF